MRLIYQDKDHSYWLDGRRVKSCSKVAQIVSDRYAIEQWGKRMVATGMTLDATLREKAAVDLDNKDLVQSVCDDAMNVAKSGARADRGTQRHRVLELHLLGQKEFITDQQRNDAAVLERTLDAYQLSPITGRVEQFVCWPDHGVVGRYDAVLMDERRGCPVLTDLKGGANAILYPHTTLAQCALYLYAPHTSIRYDRVGDKSTVTEWTSMPDGIDFDTAYVIYCDDQHDIGELWQLDMAHGLAGATLALSVVDWRKKYGYGKQAAKRLEAPKPPTLHPGDHATFDFVAGKVTVKPSTFDAQRAQLLTRYKALTPKRRQLFRDRGLHPTDLTGIAALLDELETPPNLRGLAARTSAVGAA